MIKHDQESFTMLSHRFPDEAACLHFLFDVRYGRGTLCRRCHKPAQWRLYGEPRQFASSCCYDEISPCAGTLFHQSRLPLQTWLLAMAITCSFDGLVSNAYLERHLGITSVTANRVANCIRLHMTALILQDESQLSGTVYVDEMLLTSVRRETCHKAPPLILFGLANAQRFKLFCIPDRKASTLATIVARHVLPGAKVVADGWRGYDCLSSLGFDLSRVNHARGLWANEFGETTAQVEQIWTGIRRFVEKVHVSVQSRNIWKYLGQYTFIKECRKLGFSPFSECLRSFPDVRREEARMKKVIDLRV